MTKARRSRCNAVIIPKKFKSQRNNGSCQNRIMVLSNMQSLKTIYLLLSEEASGRWSPPKRGNKSRKRKIWKLANKRSSKGERQRKCPAMRKEIVGCRCVSGEGRGNKLRLVLVRSLQQRCPQEDEVDRISPVSRYSEKGFRQLGEDFEINT